MTVFRIAAPGLSVQDRLVLRSALHLVGDSKAGWSCVDDAADADVVLRRLKPTLADPLASSAANDGIPQFVRIDIDAAGVESVAATLMLPLRARDLVPQLRMAYLALQRVFDRKSHLTPRAGHAALLNALLADIGPERHTATLLRVGARDVLSIEAPASAAKSVRELRWSSSTVRDLPSLCEQFRLGEPVTLHAATTEAADSAQPAATCQGSVAQLAWALALNDPQPELLQGLGADLRMRLLRWPDVIGLPLQSVDLRMATVLARGGITVTQLATQAHASTSQAIAFVNACHGLGNVLTLVTADAAPAVAKPRPASRLGGLVDSIRTALRGAPAKEPR